MKKKTLVNKLSRVALLLSENNLILCDVVVSAVRIRLTNWDFCMVSTCALRFISQVCAKYRLLFFVDFELNEVIIYG